MSVDEQRRIHPLFAALTFVVIAFSSWFASHSYGDSTTPQAGDPYSGAPEWLKNLGITVGLGSGPGITIWYLWYDTSKVKPRIERVHREQVESLIERHEKHVREIEERHAAHWALANTNSRADLHEISKGHREDVQRLSGAMERLIDSLEKRVPHVS